MNFEIPHVFNICFDLNKTFCITDRTYCQAAEPLMSFTHQDPDEGVRKTQGSCDDWRQDRIHERAATCNKARTVENKACKELSELLLLQTPMTHAHLAPLRTQVYISQIWAPFELLLCLHFRRNDKILSHRHTNIPVVGSANGIVLYVCMWIQIY